MTHVENNSTTYTSRPPVSSTSPRHCSPNAEDTGPLDLTGRDTTARVTFVRRDGR